MGRVITIDGPAGAGKTTAARLLAGRLGWTLLNTGSMYRAVAWAAIREGVDLDDDRAVGELAGRLDVEVLPVGVRLDGVEITDALRSSDASAAASRVAALASVRQILVDWQRKFVERYESVSEGRDQGTIVFPDADRKFYLTASPEARAGRRRLELIERGENITLDKVLRQQAERDARDAARAVGPMRPAADALVVDTSGLEAPAVLGLIERAARDDGPVPWHPGSSSGRTLPAYYAMLAVAWDGRGNRLIAVGRRRADVERAAVEDAGCIDPIIETVPGPPGLGDAINQSTTTSR